MTTLSLVQARTVIDAALAAARAAGFKPMGVVVVDAAAQVVASAHEDGASALRLDIALGKAAAALGMGVNSRVLAERTKQVPVFLGAVAAVAHTAEVEQIDDGHRPGMPADRTWPPGRVDQRGLSAPPSDRLKAAQRAVLFASSL